MQVTITYENDEMYRVDKLCVENTTYKEEGIIDLSFDDPCDIKYTKTNKLSITYLHPKAVGLNMCEEDWHFFFQEWNGGKCFLPEEYNKEEYGKIDATVTFEFYSGMGPTSATFHVKNNQ